MKVSIRFRCSSLFILSMIALSACAINVTTIPSAQPESNTPSNPVASATYVVVTTPTISPVPTELQPVSQAPTAPGSSDPQPLPFIKPADSDTPAAGICGSGAGEIVQIQLGTGPDGLPLGGRCVQVTPLQRIELVNLTLESFHVTFGMFDLEVSSGNNVLLDKPVGEYLAPGVHYLPNGPALWLKTAE